MRNRFLCGFALFFFCLTFSLLAASLGQASSSSNSAEHLKERASQYWNYKVKDDWEQAFKYEDPETVKGVNLTDYIRSVGGGTKWLGAEVESVHIQGEKARVVVALKYIWTFADPGQQPEKGFVSTLTDPWTLKNGTWYHKYRKPGPIGRGPAESQSEQGKSDRTPNDTKPGQNSPQKKN